MNNIKPTIYTIATSHLDTSWNWNFETTLNEFLPRTFTDNFKLFEKYPDYTFSFEGSYRYELCEEYYPDLFEQLKEYVKEGRWNVAGSAYENGDTNIPSPEALFRNFLYGNNYFYEKFGKKSCDVFLPDCFGFGFALPSVARHAGLLGFTTQKLTWSSFAGVPFDLGKWFGVDGNFIFGSFDTSNYNHCYKNGVRKSYIAPNKLHSNIKKFGLPYTANFHGTGDRGGAPKELSVKNICAEIRENDNKPYNVESVSSDKIFYTLDNLPREIYNRLPTYKGELVSTDHGAGGYTSRTASKRLNRRGEQLGEAAERAELISHIFCGSEYNRETLTTAWKRVIAHQFHDDITGTSLMECYERNWNDYFLSLNQFSEEYRAAIFNIARSLDTSFAKGTPVCIFNPLQYERNETVTVFCADNVFSVFNSEGEEVASNISVIDGKRAISFSAAVPALGACCYDLRKDLPSLSGGAYASMNTLENNKLVVKLNSNGDVYSIFNKELKREILSAPIRFALFDYDGSFAWPAWELSYKDVSAPAKEYPLLFTKRIISSQGARASVEVIKRARGSEFKTIISLDENSDVLRFENEIDWRAECTLLKTEFSFTSNGDALYDLGLGVIKRPNNTPKRFEVPAQMWASIPDKNGNFAVSVFSDSRTGWDKPSDNTLRLTCIHSPKNQYREHSGQHLLDFGINRFSFAVFGNNGKISEIQKKALCFNQPLNGVLADKHKSERKSLSAANLSTEGVILREYKLSESDERIAVRFNECEGKERGKVRFSLSSEIISATETDGCENEIGDAVIKDGALEFSIGKYGVKSFLLETKASEALKCECKEIALPFDFSCTSANGEDLICEKTGGFLIPSELYKSFSCGGVHFTLNNNCNNALTGKNQVIKLPENTKTLYLLASSVGGDKEVVFKAGNKTHKITVSDMYENVGAWDMLALSKTGYVKKDILAHSFTHVHGKTGDVRGKNAYMFMYPFVVSGEKSFTLPDDEDIIIFGCAVSGEEYKPLFTDSYDSLEKRGCDFKVTPELLERHKITKCEQKKGSFKFKKGFAVRQLKREIDMRF